MSELMTPISFRQLMTWITAEYDREGSVFGVHRPFHPSGKTLPIFGETIETPFGPAAGPNTQLAQNIIAAYMAGARFFEVKTVQKMDGEELAACVPRPCILANDEGYNQEWSTELTVEQAMAEYIKAYPGGNFPVPDIYAHPVVLKQMTDALQEGRAVTLPEALEAVKNRLKEVNADVQVEQEEYDEIVQIKAMFLNHDYQ